MRPRRDDGCSGYVERLGHGQRAGTPIELVGVKKLRGTAKALREGGRVEEAERLEHEAAVRAFLRKKGRSPNRKPRKPRPPRERRRKAKTGGDENAS